MEEHKKEEQERVERERKEKKMEKLIPQYQPKLYTENTDAK